MCTPINLQTLILTSPASPDGTNSCASSRHQSNLIAGCLLSTTAALEHLSQLLYIYRIKQQSLTKLHSTVIFYQTFSILSSSHKVVLDVDIKKHFPTLGRTNVCLCSPLMPGSTLFSTLTSSAMVHGTADARAHWSKSSHREVGHVSGLKEANSPEIYGNKT